MAPAFFGVSGYFLAEICWSKVPAGGADRMPSISVWEYE
jgi:hypothetical protein